VLRKLVLEVAPNAEGASPQPRNRAEVAPRLVTPNGRKLRARAQARPTREREPSTPNPEGFDPLERTDPQARPPMQRWRRYGGCGGGPKPSWLHRRSNREATNVCRRLHPAAWDGRVSQTPPPRGSQRLLLLPDREGRPRKTRAPSSPRGADCPTEMRMIAALIVSMTLLTQVLLKHANSTFTSSSYNPPPWPATDFVSR
jgi:hypothetical protein